MKNSPPLNKKKWLELSIIRRKHEIRPQSGPK